MADGSVMIVIDGDDSKFESKVKGLGGIASSALKGVGVAVGAASAAIGGLAAGAVKVGSAFEQTMANTSTMFGDVAVDTQGLNEKVLALSSSTGLAADQIGSSLYNALSAGIPVTEDMGAAMDYMEQNAKLAKAGFTDVDTAVTATAKILNAYKMDVSETDAVHKILMQTQNKGITTVGELGASLAQVTPTAAAMSVSFEQVGAALATMTAQGTPTAQATTQLNSLLAELGKQGTQAQKALESATKGTEYAGKSFQDLMAEGVPLNEVLDLMDGYAQKNGKSLLDMFSSIEAGKAALAMSGKNAEQFTGNLEAMSTEADVVGDAYDKVTDTLQSKTAMLVESVKNLGISVYEDMQEPLKDAAGTAIDMVGQIADAFETGGLTGAVEAVGGVFAQLVTNAANAAPKMIDAAVGLIQAFVSGLQQNAPAIAQGAVGIVSSLVTGAVALLPKLVEAAAQMIAALASGIGQALPTLIPAMVEAVMGMVQALYDNIPLLIDAAIALIVGLADGLIAAIPVLLEALPKIYTSLVTGLLEGVPKIIEAGIQLLTALVDALPEIISTIVAVLPEIIDGIVGALLDNLPIIIQAGIDLITALVEDLPTIIATIVAALPKIISSVVNALVDNLPLIVKAGVDLFVALIQNLPEIIAGIVEAVPDIVDGIVGAFGDLAQDIIDIGANLLHGIWQGIKDTGEWLWNQVKGFFGGVLDKIKDFLGIHSPSTEFAWFGEMSMKGFAVGMKDESGNTIKTAADLSKAILASASSWVDDRKFYDQLAAKDEADFWERMKEIGGLGAKELAEVDKKLYTAKKNTSKEAYNYSKKWIDAQVKYNGMSTQEQIEAWERVVSRGDLATEEQLAAEEALRDVRLESAQAEADAEKKVQDEARKAAEEYQKTLESRTESLRSFVGLFDEIKGKTDVTGRELLKNLRDQVDAFQKWQEDMTALQERGVTGPLLDELQEMGPKAADSIHALTTLTDKELDEYMDLFAEKGKLAAEQAESEIPPVEVPVEPGTLTKAGNQSLVDTANGAVDTVLETANARNGDLTDAANDTMTQVCDAVLARRADMQSVGESAMAGLCDGLREQGRVAIDAAREVADGIIAEMQRALDIHSPSRKMARLVGKPTAQGFFVGFQDEMEGMGRKMRAAVDSETGKLSAHAAARAESGAAGQTTREVRETVKVVEKVVGVEFTGDGADVARAMRPRLKREDRRVGPNLGGG